MKYCRKIGSFDPIDAAIQIDANGHLWDQNPLRTTFPGTYFAETSDIWLRFGDDPRTWAGPHFPVFYPAWQVLTELHAIVFDCMARVKATMLGGILLTRMPPGSRILPHCDKGGWHADFYTTKVYAILKANEKCTNRFEDEEVVMRAGELWEFNNLVTHSVENNGDDERLALIVCMRTE